MSKESNGSIRPQANTVTSYPLLSNFNRSIEVPIAHRILKLFHSARASAKALITYPLPFSPFPVLKFGLHKYSQEWLDFYLIVKYM